MWYARNKNLIRYDQAIFCKYKDCNGCNEYILLPQINDDIDDIIGYNWFDIIEGCYISSVCFSSIEEAIEQRRSTGYKIYNGKITIEKNND